MFCRHCGKVSCPTAALYSGRARHPPSVWRCLSYVPAGDAGLNCRRLPTAVVSRRPAPGRRALHRHRRPALGCICRSCHVRLRPRSCPAGTLAERCRAHCVRPSVSLSASAPLCPYLYLHLYPFSLVYPALPLSAEPGATPGDRAGRGTRSLPRHSARRAQTPKRRPC